MSAEAAPVAPMGPEVSGPVPPNMQKLQMAPNPWKAPQELSGSEGPDGAAPETEWLGGLAPDGPQPSNLDRVPLNEVLPQAEQQAKMGKIKKLGHFITSKFAKVTEVSAAAPDLHSELTAGPLQNQPEMGNEEPLWPPAGFKPHASSEQSAAWKSLAEQAGLYENKTPMYTESTEADEDEGWDPPELAVPVDDGELAEPPADMSVTERLEQYGFVRTAPRFVEMLSDETRTNLFKYVVRETALWNDDPSSEDTVVQMTEHDGLIALNSFLGDYIQSEIKAGRGGSRSAEIAHGIQENLTFIGEKEYKEAVLGLAAMWKEYLDGDPSRQLCVLSKISEGNSKRKSDVYLRENILDTFSDEELAKYSGRILTQLDDISEPPESTKIILLDDWSIGGSQMRGAYTAIRGHEKLATYADSVEINLIASSGGRLKHGLKTNAYDSSSPSIPVKAYFKTHDAPETSQQEHRGHVTGTHSAVDYDFEAELHVMARRMGDNEGEAVNLPPLANIIRPYRYAKPRITVGKNGKIVRHEV